MAGSAVAAEALRSVSGHGADDAGRRNLADAVIIIVSDEKVARGIHCHTIWNIKLGRRGRSAIAAEALRSISRYRADDASRCDLADAVIA